MCREIRAGTEGGLTMSTAHAIGASTGLLVVANPHRASAIEAEGPGRLIVFAVRGYVLFARIDAGHASAPATMRLKVD